MNRILSGGHLVSRRWLGRNEESSTGLGGMTIEGPGLGGKTRAGLGFADMT